MKRSVLQSGVMGGGGARSVLQCGVMGGGRYLRDATANRVAKGSCTVAGQANGL